MIQYSHLAMQPPYLEEFRLENGLPVWIFRLGEALLEKRVCMVHTQNTTCITYTLLQGEGRLEIRPVLHVRPHEDSVEGPSHEKYRFTAVERGYELCVSDTLPSLKFTWQGEQSSFHTGAEQIASLRYRIEQSRGYDWRGGSGRREDSLQTSSQAYRHLSFFPLSRGNMF